MYDKYDHKEGQLGRIEEKRRTWSLLVYLIYVHLDALVWFTFTMNTYRPTISRPY
jgi:hypothetical protein